MTKKLQFGACLVAIVACASVTGCDDGGQKSESALFEGVNVHIPNGEGCTNGATNPPECTTDRDTGNGSGNLIVGYHEAGTDDASNRNGSLPPEWIVTCIVLTVLGAISSLTAVQAIHNTSGVEANPDLGRTIYFSPVVADKIRAAGGVSAGEYGEVWS